MVTGILLASAVLVFGLLSCLYDPKGEIFLAVATLLALAILAGTLTVTTPQKSDTEKLKELQSYCVSIGVATMTPVVTTTEFQLLATGAVQIKGEADDK